MRNLTFFDGTRRDMQTGRDSLVTGNRITALPPTGDGPPDAAVIDGGGRAVIPGLIDSHWHATLVGVTQAQAMTADIGFVHLRTGREAGATLPRGFTTVREVGGPAFGPKEAIDAGALAGLLVLDADPAAGRDWRDTPDTRVAVIVKDGQIVTARI